MFKFFVIGSVIFVIIFLLLTIFFLPLIPFWHNNGHWYRGILCGIVLLLSFSLFFVFKTSDKSLFYGFLPGIALLFSFLFFFPFWHVGGNYYRAILLIYNIRPASGGFLPAPEFAKEINLVRWAEPISFEYVGGSYAKDKFNVFSDLLSLQEFDAQTFRQIQAPLTGEYWYADNSNLRNSVKLCLKADSGSAPDKFDIQSFQPLGNHIFKDKTGVYSYFKESDTTENFERQGNRYERNIDLFKKHQDLDAETFRLEFCDEKNCRASDRNGSYKMNRANSRNYVKIEKIQ